MKFDEQHYFRAAVERMEQAQALYGQEGRYALTMYVAGVAVECMLRAFKLRRSRVFDERHDLLLLLRESGMLQVDEANMIARGMSRDEASKYAHNLRAAVDEIYSLWANDFRYASESRLRAELIRMKRHHRAKGDVLKASARQLTNAARKFIDRGILLWQPSAKK